MPQVDLDKIKKLMHQRGITQEQLASALKITPSSVYRKLSGEQEFKANQVGLVAELLKVSVCDLFGWHKDQPQGGIF